MIIPENALIRSHTDGAYFSDTFSTTIQYEGQSAMDCFLIIAKSTPSWVNALMSVRNSITKRIGLKHLGSMGDIDFSKPGSSYQTGDTVGIFTVHSIKQNEVILEDRDKHLNVKVSFHLAPNHDEALLHATTVVHVNNALGRIYMFFVGPIHKIIVPHSLKMLSRHHQTVSVK